MGNDTVISFSDPALRDELSELVRQGAQRIIRHAVEAELKVFLEGHAAERDEEGRRAVVRNGYLPEREILTGIGTVPVRIPKTRDRAGEGRRFRSELLPPYLKKTRRLEMNVPVYALNSDKLEKLKEILVAHKGEVPARLTITEPDTFETVIALPETLRVNPSDELLVRVDKLFGTKVVRLG